MQPKLNVYTVSFEAEFFSVHMWLLSAFRLCKCRKEWNRLFADDITSHFCCGANCRWSARTDFLHRKHYNTHLKCLFCIIYSCSDWSNQENTRKKPAKNWSDMTRGPQVDSVLFFCCCCFFLFVLLAVRSKKVGIHWLNL